FLRSLEVHRYHGNQQGRHGGDHDCPDHSLATPALAHEEKSHSESAQTNRRLNHFRVKSGLQGSPMEARTDGPSAAFAGVARSPSGPWRTCAVSEADH